MNVRTVPLLALALVLAASRPAAAQERLVDGIAAQVGSDIVLVSEVRRMADPVEKRMREAGAPDGEVEKMRAEILERLIERRLIQQAVQRTEIDATEREIDAAVEAIAEENGLTLEQVVATVKAKGLSLEEYREQLRAEIQRKKLISGMVASKVRVEEDEIRERYEKRFADQPTTGEEVHLRHLLVPFVSEDPEDQAEVCARVEEARGRVAGGESFARVAAELSVLNPETGGDVGWIHAKSLAGWMNGPVAALEAGQTSDVLREPFGCNLLHLVERRSFEPVTFEEARPSLERQIFEERMADEFSDFLERLRGQTYIERKGVFADATPSLGSAPSFE